MVTRASLDVLDPAVLDRGNHFGTQPISATEGLAEALAASDIASGKWTPTLTNVINLSASGALEATYQRIGNIVTCWGAFTADPVAAAGTTTSLRMSLPIPSDFTSTLQSRGVISTNIAHHGGTVNSDATNDQVTMSWASETTANVTWTFYFSYEIL